MRPAAIALLSALLVLALPGRADADAPQTQETPPAPTRWVTDTANFITPAARTAIDTRLERYQQKTGHQILVWIGDTLDKGANRPELADWASRTFAAWKPGRKGADDGLVIFVFSVDRKIDIEVGYGLEGQVTDAIASRVIHEVMAPRLKAGDPDGAVSAGVDAVLTAIDGRPFGDDRDASAPPASQWSFGAFSMSEKVLYGLLLLAFLGLLIFNPRLALLLLWSLAGRAGLRGGAAGSGGFSGGGGRSGGGGSRGSW